MPGCGVVQAAFDLRMGLPVVAFERRHVIGTGLQNLLGDFFLAAHGVERDDAAREFQGAQERRHRRDFVGFVGHLHPAEHQRVARGPGAHNDARRIAAVQRHDFPGRRAAQRLRPAQKTLRKNFGFKGGEHAVERVMGGDAPAQAQKRLEPSAFGVAEAFHVIETFAAAEQTTQTDDRHVRQFVLAAALDARIRQPLQMLNQTESAMRLHPVSCAHCKYKVHTFPRKL